MFELILLVLVLWCLFKFVSRNGSLLVIVILVIAIILDPAGTRMFFSRLTAWFAVALDRLMYGIGF